MDVSILTPYSHKLSADSSENLVEAETIFYYNQYK